jgi:hypothetical protein
MVGECSLWTVIEPAICLFAACLPALRPLIPRSANVKALTVNGVENVPVQERDHRNHPDRRYSTKRLSEYKSDPWNSDDGAPPPNVAHAEYYHRMDGYDRALNNVRSSFHPDRMSQESKVSGPLGNDQSWLDGPETPPQGIMVRNEVVVEEGYSPKP